MDLSTIKVRIQFTVRISYLKRRGTSRISRPFTPLHAPFTAKEEGPSPRLPVCRPTLALAAFPLTPLSALSARKLRISGTGRGRSKRYLKIGQVRVLVVARCVLCFNPFRAPGRRVTRHTPGSLFARPVGGRA